MYGKFYRPKKRKWILPAVFGLLVLAGILTQLPPVKSRLAWRFETARTYVRVLFNPVAAQPTPVSAAALEETPVQATPTATLQPATPTPTPVVSPTPMPTPTPLPGKIILNPPQYEKQEMNNCGPATLTMFLRSFGWTGDQKLIAEVIKQFPEDRNVNIEELLFYTRNYVGWLRTEFRVGGNIDILRSIIAQGYPVMIEESFIMEESYWPNDDRWAGHYLLVTGYDDTTRTFVTQDSFLGENRIVSYADLDKSWQTFNRVFFVAFPPEQEDVFKSLLGSNWDEKQNRQNALDTARYETETTPNNPFAWFNLGSNLVYFEKYNEAARAYDKARELTLPQRMLRYQFGPFFAYFHASRTEDLLAITQYALKVTPNSEEALLWHGWGLYRSGKKAEALAEFQKALEAHPGYFDAQYALDFANSN